MKKLATMLRFLLFCGLCFVLLGSVTYVLRDKQEAEYLYPFYKEECQFDVLLLGSSHVRDGIQPLEMFGEYGISSYNLAQGGQQFASNYYLLKDCISRMGKMPKVVVFDVYMAVRGDRLYENTARIHQVADNMPLLSTKYEMVIDLLGKESIAEYLFPIIQYHSRWQLLTAEDFTQIESTKLGASFKKGITEFEQMSIPAANEKNELSDVVLTYLQKIIDLCKENEIELVLTALPFHATQTDMKILNAVADIAETERLTYINYFYLLEEICFDYQKDLADWGHLNCMGAAKVSEHLGQYLKETYSLRDCREDAAYQHWWEWYDAYEVALNSMLSAEIKDMERYLEKYQDEEHIIMISVKDQANKNLPAELISYMESRGLKFELQDSSTRCFSYLAVLENGVVCHEEIAKDRISYEFSYDDLHFELSSAGYYAGNESSMKVNGEEHSLNKRGFNIIVFSKENKRVINSVNYDYFSGEVQVTR